MSGSDPDLHEAKNKIMQSSTYTIGLLGYKMIAWIGIVFFMFCAVMSWLSGVRNISPFFLIFVAISITMLLIASKIEISTEAITVFSPLATYKIYWNEIKRIELGNQGTFVFHGDNKRLVVPAGTWWTGKQRKEAYYNLLNEIETRNISVKDSFTSDYKIHKNTKVNTTGEKHIWFCLSAIILLEFHLAIGGSL